MTEIGDAELDPDGATIVTEPKTGSLYFILGDCVEGCYLVKCLSIGEGSLQGRYLTNISGITQEASVDFQESSICDTFYKESILFRGFNVD